jgi:hypothetical protein
MRPYRCLMLMLWLVTATGARAQSEPCLAGTDSPDCGIKVTMNPPFGTSENVFWVPNEITIDVPMRIRATRVVLRSGPSGTGVSDAFKTLAETKRYEKAGGVARFKISTKTCTGVENAFDVNIYSPRFPYPLTVNVQPFECKQVASK